MVPKLQENLREKDKERGLRFEVYLLEIGSKDITYEQMGEGGTLLVMKDSIAFIKNAKMQN